uniref:Uncharacterized protein n=1 Tax=Bactrocera latifrons TaxID=174628 RepID=A0A0K8VMQ4_BACLA
MKLQTKTIFLAYTQHKKLKKQTNKTVRLPCTTSSLKHGYPPLSFPYANPAVRTNKKKTISCPLLQISLQPTAYVNKNRIFCTKYLYVSAAYCRTNALVFQRLSGSHTDCNDDCNRHGADATTGAERAPTQDQFAERFIRYSLPDGYHVVTDEPNGGSNYNYN